MSVPAWTEKNAVNVSEIVWINREYGSITSYSNLEHVVKDLQKALADQEAGLWKELYVEIKEEHYDSGHYLSIRGKRPENATEKAQRLYDSKEYERREKEQYERLREKYGAEQEKKS